MKFIIGKPSDYREGPLVKHTGIEKPPVATRKFSNPVQDTQ